MAQKYNMGPPKCYNDMKFGKPLRGKVANAVKLDKEYAKLPTKQKAQYLRTVYYTAS